MSDKQYFDNLDKFGVNFQISTIAILVSNRDFLEQVNDIIDPNYFSMDAHQWIVRQILDHSREYKELPTPTVFKVKLNDVVVKELKDSIIEQIKLIYSRLDNVDLKFIQESFLTFCKQQKIKSAIYKSSVLLESEGYDQIRHLMDDAMKAGIEKHVGHIYSDDIDLRMAKSARNFVPTCWPVIDQLMDGGLAGGELGIICAPSGVGKSWALARIGANMIMAGKNVIHFTMELNENYVGLRYDACITGIDSQNIRHSIDEVKEAVSKVPGKLIIKYFPLKSISAFTLKYHIEKTMAVRGIKIDAIIIDYADIIRSEHGSRGSNSYENMGSVYQEIRQIGGELQIPIWSASQTSRSSLSLDIIEGNQIADSYQKIMTSDFIMSISRKANDKKNNCARFHVIKNRFGPDSITFPAYMNTGNGEIELFDENSMEGQNLMRKMENEFNDEAFDKFNQMKSKS